ncbi:MAG: flagellar protein FlaG [Treponema sp.]|nr:flagellar protein FlaG [Treponema sp.]
MSMTIVSAGANAVGLPVERISGVSKNRTGNTRISPLTAGSIMAEKAPVSQKIQDVARNLEQISLSFNRRLQFVVDHKSNEITVKVIDKTTDKVIKVLPPEELQRLHSRIEETIGFLFDETV